MLKVTLKLENKNLDLRVIDSPAKLSFYRGVKYLNLRQNDVWRFSDESITYYHNSLIKLIEEDKKPEAIRLIKHVEDLRSMKHTMIEVMEYAHVFILLPEEDEKLLDNKFKEMKIELANNSEEVMDFFLSTVMPVYWRQTSSSPSIIDYLKDKYRLYKERKLLDSILRNRLTISFKT